MHKLTILAAALAAGVMNFAVNTAHGESLSFRKAQAVAVKADRSERPTAAAAAAPKASAKKTAAAKAGKAAVRRKTKRTKVAVDTTTTASIPRAAKAASKTDSGAVPYSAIIARHAASYGVPFSLAKAVIRIESNFRPHLTGSAGEVGLMQIKPATARMLGYTGSVKGLYDPETNIKYGMKYLAMAQGLGGGTTCGTILKYNAGHGAKRMNPVSSAYCSKVKIQMAAAATPA